MSDIPDSLLNQATRIHTYLLHKEVREFNKYFTQELIAVALDKAYTQIFYYRITTDGKLLPLPT